MRRREFITVLGGAALWPLAAQGQQAVTKTMAFLPLDRLPEPGQTSLRPCVDWPRWASLGARTDFVGPASAHGFVEGGNLALEYRAAESKEDRLAALAGDLVQRRVSVIVAPSGPSIVAAKAATTSIPIVFFTGFDPVASGFVAE